MEHEKAAKSHKKVIKNLSKNYWAVATIVLAVLLVVVLVVQPSEDMVATVTAEEAGQKVVDFAAAQGAEATLVSVEEEDGLYKVTLSMLNPQTNENTDVPVYVTLSGESLVAQLIPLSITANAADTTPTDTKTQASAEVVPTERPTVELYVWGYCPYGVQAQGPFTEVASLLGDTADFVLVPYYDGHGAYETQQNQIESCIQKLAPEKFWDYSAKFVSDVYPACASVRTEECDKTEATKVMEAVGIDADAVFECVDSEGDSLFAAASAKASKYGVTGSPSFVINGVMVQVARNADAIKTAVCSAYTVAPEECGTTLDSTSAAASGNC